MTVEPPEIFVAMQYRKTRAEVPLSLKLIRPIWYFAILLAGFLSVYKGLLYLIIDALLIRLSPEKIPPKSKQLLDEAFLAIKERLEREGFKQVARKRKLQRSRDGVEAVVELSAGKYNGTGQIAEFSIYLTRISSELPPNHINHDLIWVSHIQERGEWKAEVDLGQLRIPPRVFAPNLAPRLRRKARIRRAVRLLERCALPWLEAGRG